VASARYAVTRRQLAELYGVTVEVIRAWERRGKEPPKVTNLKRGGIFRRLYTGAGKLRLEDMVARNTLLHSRPHHPRSLSDPSSTTAPPVRLRCSSAAGNSKAN
jgi:hypothetical protein